MALPLFQAEGTALRPLREVGVVFVLAGKVGPQDYQGRRGGCPYSVPYGRDGRARFDEQFLAERQNCCFYGFCS